MTYTNRAMKYLYRIESEFGTITCKKEHEFRCEHKHLGEVITLFRPDETNTFNELFPQMTCTFVKQNNPRDRIRVYGLYVENGEVFLRFRCTMRPDEDPRVSYDILEGPNPNIKTYKNLVLQFYRCIRELPENRLLYVTGQLSFFDTER